MRFDAIEKPETIARLTFIDEDDDVDPGDDGDEEVRP
jgi:ParB family chromosome partitioning protein